MTKLTIFTFQEIQTKATLLTKISLNLIQIQKQTLIFSLIQIRITLKLKTRIKWQSNHIKQKKEQAQVV